MPMIELHIDGRCAAVVPDRIGMVVERTGGGCRIFTDHGGWVTVDESYAVVMEKIREAAGEPEEPEDFLVAGFGAPCRQNPFEGI